MRVPNLTMSHKGILYLSNEDVKKVLDLGRAIEITEQALRDHSEERVIWSTPEDLGDQAGTRLAILGNRLRLGDATRGGFSHSLHQGRGRQPRSVATGTGAAPDSDSQRPRRR